jgi:solute carrier family 25 iron transporter 28/37
MTPWDVIKQRMQISHSPYRSILHCARSTYQLEGIHAFFKSYRTTVCSPLQASNYLRVCHSSRYQFDTACTLCVNLQLVMNVPYTALHFTTYESAKKLLAKDTDELDSDKHSETLAEQVSGSAPSGVALLLFSRVEVE